MGWTRVPEQSQKQDWKHHNPPKTIHKGTQKRKPSHTHKTDQCCPFLRGFVLCPCVLCRQFYVCSVCVILPIVPIPQSPNASSPMSTCLSVCLPSLPILMCISVCRVRFPHVAIFRYPALSSVSIVSSVLFVIIVLQVFGLLLIFSWIVSRYVSRSISSITPAILVSSLFASSMFFSLTFSPSRPIRDFAFRCSLDHLARGCVDYWVRSLFHLFCLFVDLLSKLRFSSIFFVSGLYKIVCYALEDRLGRRCEFWSSVVM